MHLEVADSRTSKLDQDADVKGCRLLFQLFANTPEPTGLVAACKDIEIFEVEGKQSIFAWLPSYALDYILLHPDKAKDPVKRCTR
eukprot:4350861-Amphidinium_carterae.1